MWNCGLNEWDCVAVAIYFFPICMYSCDSLEVMQFAGNENKSPLSSYSIHSFSFARFVFNAVIWLLCEIVINLLEMCENVYMLFIWRCPIETAAAAAATHSPTRNKNKHTKCDYLSFGKCVAYGFCFRSMLQIKSTGKKPAPNRMDCFVLINIVFFSLLVRLPETHEHIIIQYVV